MLPFSCVPPLFRARLGHSSRHRWPLPTFGTPGLQSLGVLAFQNRPVNWLWCGQATCTGSAGTVSCRSGQPRSAARQISALHLDNCRENVSGRAFGWNGTGYGLTEHMLHALIREARCKPSRQHIGRNPPRRANDNEQWNCGTCGVFKSRDEFQKYAGARSGIVSACKVCRRQLQYIWRCTLRGHIFSLLGAAKQKSHLRGHVFSLTSDDLLDMLWAQRGKCFYSGVPLDYVHPHSDWRTSLERLNNEHGYTVDNVALIACEFNTSAQWSKEKVRQVPMLHNTNLDESQLGRLIGEARAKPRREPRTTPREARPCLCNSLVQLEPDQDASCSGSADTLHHCHVCGPTRHAPHPRTLRANTIELVCNARKRAERRNQVCNLSYTDILDMLLFQSGRCYYSGVPMECNTPRSDWRMSLERLNNDTGYTTDNCVLVALEFNSSDFSRNKKNVFRIHGTAQWSREKVQFVWGML